MTQPTHLNYDELMAQKMPVLRNTAATLGLGVAFSEKKTDLANRIVEFSSTLQPNTTRDEKPKLSDPKDDTLRCKPPAQNSTQKSIANALTNHVEAGLHLDFPEDDQYYMRKGIKEDSGNIRQPLRNIVQRAEILMQ